MPSLIEDQWVTQQAVTHDLSEIEDCAIAVDATYYLQLFLDNPPYHEPLLPALGGLTGIQNHIEKDLDQWQANRITPFFIFDGQSIAGQDDVAVARARKAVEKTDEAWKLYFNGEAQSAVTAFGSNSGAYRPQALYPLLQKILKQRSLHFLVPPYNAAAQIAYFDMIDSDQCAGIMGSQELLLYPINDSVIRMMDWDAKTLTALSKKHIIKGLGVAEPMFVDALLMTGTSFLPPFPPLHDISVVPRPPTVMDAINMLRTADKSIANACASFNDILQAKDPMWLDKYRKARMAVNHFIYIAENGEVKVNDFEKLTGDNFEYLGLQLPPELFHYLNTGLIGPRVLSWITHCKITVLPTLDGIASPEYKNLISTQLTPIKELTLGLLIPRLNRGIQHREVKVKVWYDDKFEHTVDLRAIQPSLSSRADSWNLSEAAVKANFFPQPAAGSIAFELNALGSADMLQNTLGRERVKGGLGSPDAVVSIAIWKFLHLRGFLNDRHELTPWGSALSAAFAALEPTVKKNPEVPGLYEALVLGLELIRFDLLNTTNKHGTRDDLLHGLPMNGSEEDKSSLLLISRCATLLKLRHEANGYTGPLSKNLLNFHSLCSAVREADRDLVDAIVASMFMHGHVKRERDDGWQLSHRLPFFNDPDVAMAIAVKTLLDDLPLNESAEERKARLVGFPTKFVPYATHFVEDLEICYAFFDALHAAVKSLDKEVSATEKAAWDSASNYLQPRR